MSQDLIKREPRDIAVGGILLTARGALVSGPVTKENITGAFTLLDQFQRGTNWNCGDLQILGERAFGEDWLHQQLDDYFPAMAPVTKKQCRWVASVFADPATRVPALSWSHHREVAGITDGAVRLRLLNECLDGGQQHPKSVLSQKVRTYKIAQGRGDETRRDGTYRVLLLDPPWDYDSLTQDVPDDHLALWREPDTLAQMIDNVAGEDSAMFLWATVADLPLALCRLDDAWGFAYRTHFVCHKPIEFDRYNGVAHALLLMGTRGYCVPETDAAVESLLCDECSWLSRNSHCPEGIYCLIEAMYPEGPYIQLFPQRTREGWDD